jgi:hypothetical protein
MGDDAKCTARLDDQASEGKASLEHGKILFRGDFRVAVPLKDIKKLTCDSGRLVVHFGTRRLTLELGATAEKWANRIRSPKSLIDKLNVKPDSKVALLGVADTTFLKQLREATPHVSLEKPGKNLDLVFFQSEDKTDLNRLKSLKGLIKKNGAIWVVFPKGQKHIREIEVIQGGLDAGLVDNKVVRFSDTHTALRFVIRLADR